MRRDQHTGDPDFFSLARDYLHTYLPTVQQSSPKTIQAYRISLECFLDYLGEHEHIERGQVSFDHFDRHYLKAWLAWMIGERGYAPTTIALRLSTVKAFLAYCSHEDITLVTLAQTAFGLRPSPKSQSSTSPSPKHEPCWLPSTARQPSRAETGCC